MITNNWQKFYRQHAGGRLYQRKCSIDLSGSIAIKIMNVENQTTNNNKKFVAVVFMDDKELGIGFGNAKKEAEQEACKNSLTLLWPFLKTLVLFDLENATFHVVGLFF